MCVLNDVATFAGIMVTSSRDETKRSQLVAIMVRVCCCRRCWPQMCAKVDMTSENRFYWVSTVNVGRLIGPSNDVGCRIFRI